VSSGADDDQRAPRRGLLVAVLALGTTALSLMQSLVVPLLPAIGAQLGVSANAAGWVLTANLLAAAVATPVLGRLGDVWGERPVALGVLAAMSAGTLLALVTTSLPLLLVARVLQGASYGLFPLAISVLRRERAAHHRHRHIEAGGGQLAAQHADRQRDQAVGRALQHPGRQQQR
jgi:predicted MFS family arabinose efflux permease